MTEQEWFAEPPPAQSPSGEWEPIADLLRTHPNEWRIVADYDTSRKASYAARRIRRAEMTVFRPAGTFDAVSRGRDVWATYIEKEKT